MHLQISELSNFYNKSPLGEFVRQVLLGHARQIWPDVEGRTILGFGYAVPLQECLADAYRCIYLMPHSQGSEPVIGRRGNMATESSDVLWPVPTSSIELCIIMHGLETCSSATMLLSECWRALAPEGSLMIIVPNRAGFWARRDITPFGFGRPYSASQLESLVLDCRFEPISRSAALYAPPGKSGSVGKMARTVERAAGRIPLGYTAGVHIMVARKRVFSRHRSGIGETVKSTLASLKGSTLPDPRPASGRVGCSPAGKARCKGQA